MAMTVEQFLLSSQISDNPLEVKTHFQMLDAPNKQGQARYRCLTCDHEFRCTGRIRLVQHVTGESLTRFKHVKACPSPFLPLKENLIQREQIEMKMITSQKFHQLKRSLLESQEPKQEGENQKKDENSFSEQVFKRTADEEEGPAVVVGAYVHPMMSLSSESTSPQSGRISVSPRSVEVASCISTKPKGSKRSRPSSLFSSSSTTFSSYPVKKLSLPPTDDQISNDRLISLMRKIYSLVPEIVEDAIVLESMEDEVKMKLEKKVRDSSVVSSNIPLWVSSLLSSLISTSQISSVNPPGRLEKLPLVPSTTVFANNHGSSGFSFPSEISLGTATNVLNLKEDGNFNALQLAYLMELYASIPSVPTHPSNALKNPASFFPFT